MLKDIGDWPIKPYESIGSLKLGSERSQLHTILGYEFTTKSDWGVPHKNVDVYSKASLQLHYDKNEKLVCVEASSPYEPVFEGLRLIGIPVEYVITCMQSMGYAALFDDDSSLRFETVGISLYAPSYKGIIEVVSIYIEGLYENDEEVYGIQ